MEVLTWKACIEGGLASQLPAIEQECWAPWLAASPESMMSRALVFEPGQLAIVNDSSEVLATLSTNKINWDGKAKLPSWDDVAGDPTDYSQTYKPDGNTLTFMSMNVAPKARGLKLPKVLIEQAVALCQKQGIEHCIGSFRPSGFGEAVKQAYEAGYALSFAEYVASTRHNGEAIDPWLRVLGKFGMQQIAIDYEAMIVPLTPEEVKQHGGDKWEAMSYDEQKVLWCNETGFVYCQLQNYAYKEANVWGKIPILKK